MCDLYSNADVTVLHIVSEYKKPKESQYFLSVI